MTQCCVPFHWSLTDVFWFTIVFYFDLLRVTQYFSHYFLQAGGEGRRKVVTFDQQIKTVFRLKLRVPPWKKNHPHIDLNLCAFLFLSPWTCKVNPVSCEGDMMFFHRPIFAQWIKNKVVFELAFKNTLIVCCKSRYAVYKKKREYLVSGWKGWARVRYAYKVLLGGMLLDLAYRCNFPCDLY